jgi:hypothetical protein
MGEHDPPNGRVESRQETRVMREHSQVIIHGREGQQFWVRMRRGERTDWDGARQPGG